MSLGIITPTRDRAQQLQLVIQCINNQSLKPDFWVVADDSRQALQEGFFDSSAVPVTYLHEAPKYKSSTGYNSARALQACKADKIIFIDDDDYYPASYIQSLSKKLINNNEMVGDSQWIDYRLSTGCYRIRHKTRQQMQAGDTMTEWHSSGILGAQLRDKMIQTLYADPETRYNDVVCFKKLFKHGPYKCVCVDFGKDSAISLKDYGVGTAGAIAAHRSDAGLIKDPDFKFFKQKLGQDWIRYQKYLGRLL